MTLLLSFLIAISLFLGMLLCVLMGRRSGERYLAKDPQGARTGLAGIEGAIFALFGLLIAFTFSGASSRFDDRRHLIVEEANDIGTAYLRLQLLPTETLIELKELFKEYTTARMDVYRKLPDISASMERFRRADQLQGVIWNKAVEGCRNGNYYPCAIILLPALNEMFDITNTRFMAAKIHPHRVIFFMLFGLGLVCAFLAGFSMAGVKYHNWLYSIGFAFVVAFTLYVILDIEHPRLGYIRVDNFDQDLQRVLDNMK